MSHIGNNPNWNTSKHNPQSADPTNPVEGQMFYSDGTSRAEGLWVYKNNNWVFVEGGAADADTIRLIRADDLADVTTSNIDLQGQNADFDGGGTITASSLSLSTTSTDLILDSTQVIKYDPNANGQNDYWGWTFSIPRGFRNRDLGLSLAYKNDATTVDDDFRVAIKIKDGAQAGNIAYHNLEAVNTTNGTAKTFNVAEFCPEDCTELEIGIQNTSTTTTVEFIMDNIVLTSNAFVFSNLTDVQTLQLDTSNGTGSTGNRTRRWTNITRNVGNTSLMTYNADATNGDSITINRAGRLTVSLTDNFSGASRAGISLNASSTSTDIQSLAVSERLGMDSSTSGNEPCATGASLDVVAGDIIRCHTGGSSDGNAARSTVIFHMEAETEHIITPAKSTLSDWISYTPVFNGFGSPTNVNFKYRRIGDSIQIAGGMTAGTTTAVEARIGLPIVDGVQYTVDSIVDASAEEIWGSAARASTAQSNMNVLLCSGNSYVNFAESASGQLVKANGSTIFSSGADMSFFCTVPIAELSSEVTFLAAIPTTVEVSKLVDGVTAPDTISGTAQIYVDTADGDLKIKFGDGTIKTIVTDT